MGEMEQMKQEAEQLKKQIAVMLAAVVKLLTVSTPCTQASKVPSSASIWSRAFSMYILGALCSSAQTFKC